MAFALAWSAVLVGSLHEILNYFLEKDINMTRIESRPTPGDPNNYNFYVDFDGKPGNEKIDNLLDELRKHCSSVKVLHDRLVPWFPREIRHLDLSVGEVMGSSCAVHLNELKYFYL
jgi:hypothetical protein